MQKRLHCLLTVLATAGENLYYLHHIQFVASYHVDADIEVNTIYFDEAHNSVKKNFFPATEFFAENADRAYSYTATPKHSLTPKKPGMNWSVYGQVLANIPAPELVEGGYILPPKVVVKQLPLVKGRKVMYAEDADNLLETIDDNNIDKTLICARTTKQIVGLLLSLTSALSCINVDILGWQSHLRLVQSLTVRRLTVKSSSTR